MKLAVKFQANALFPHREARAVDRLTVRFHSVEGGGARHDLSAVGQVPRICGTRFAVLLSVFKLRLGGGEEVEIDSLENVLFHEESFLRQARSFPQHRTQSRHGESPSIA